MPRLASAALALLVTGCTTQTGANRSPNEVEGLRSHPVATEQGSPAKSPIDARNDWIEAMHSAAVGEGAARDLTPEERANQESQRIELEQQRLLAEQLRISSEKRIELLMAKVESSSDIDLDAEWLQLYVHPLPPGVGQMLIYVQRGVPEILTVNCLVVTKSPFLFPSAASMGVDLKASVQDMEAMLGENFELSYKSLLAITVPASLFSRPEDRSLLIYERVTKVRTIVPWEAVEALRRVRADRWPESPHVFVMSQATVETSR